METHHLQLLLQSQVGLHYFAWLKIYLDEVEVYAIDRHSLRVLFNINPTLGMKFYKYLCLIVEKRIHAKEEQLIKE